MCLQPPLLGRRYRSPARGTLNAGHDTISSPSHSITWSLDLVCSPKTGPAAMRVS